MEWQQSLADIRTREASIAELNEEIAAKETELADCAKLMEGAKEETSKAEVDLSNLFDIRRYDTGFMADIVTLLKPKSVAVAQPKPKARATKAV